ncbi:MAG: hypothetical protein CMH53_01785 [Myxococcales bacterium]|nr:hypothetical protein [Myxococcales bacterium]
MIRLLLCIVVVCVVEVGCTERNPRPSAHREWTPPVASEPDRAPIPLPTRAQVTLFDQVAGPTIDVEVAHTEIERNQGLMFRKSLGPMRGMVFVMPRTHDWAFYMRNTLIPLDIIFIDQSWRVVGVVAKAAPLTETLRRVGQPSRYVLELDGGQAARLGITRGSKLRFSQGGSTP